MGGVAESGGDFVFIRAFDGGNVLGVGDHEAENGKVTSAGLVYALFDGVNVGNLVDQLLSESFATRQTIVNADQPFVQDH